MKYIYRYWILVPLLLLAIISRDWVEEPVQKETEATIDMTQSEADYYLEKFETRKLDQQGKPEYIVSGDTLSHYPEDDSSIIKDPRLVLYREGLVWTMESAQGKLTKNPEIFHFAGKVSMLRQRQANASLASSTGKDEAGNTTAGLDSVDDETDVNAAFNNASSNAVSMTADTIQLETSDVFVSTEQNYVETDQPIKVTADNWQLSSVGLKSNIDDGTLELLSNVTGRYEVNN